MKADVAEPAKARRRRRIDMTPLEGIVGYQLRVAQLAVFSDFLKSFADMELRPVDYSILRLIQANPGVRQGQLAEALGIKRANMVGLLHGLEARKLIERCATEDDRRANALHLTKSGRAFVTKVQQVWTRHEQRIIDLIGGTEKRDQLIELLRKIPPLVSARVTRVKRK